MAAGLGYLGPVALGSHGEVRMAAPPKAGLSRPPVGRTAVSLEHGVGGKDTLVACPFSHLFVVVQGAAKLQRLQPAADGARLYCVTPPFLGDAQGTAYPGLGVFPGPRRFGIVQHTLSPLWMRSVII